MNLFASAALAATIGIVSSAAMAETRTIAAAGFTGIDISAGIKATVSIGPTFSVTAESPNGDDFNGLRIGVEGDSLRASYDPSLLDLLNLGGHQMRVRIVMPSLTHVDASSSAQVEVSGNAADALSVDVSSGANVAVTGASAAQYTLDVSSGAALTIAGACGSAKLDASTGASLDAKALACRDADADASTGSHIEVAAEETIAADASTGAQVTVHGHPQVKSSDADTGGNVDFADK